MTPETQQLLYADETGELVGVAEVQLMEPIPAERIPSVRALLASDDIVARFHALLVLVGWGDEGGLAHVETVLAGTTNPFDGVDTHRFGSVDLAYDRIADALSTGLTFNHLDLTRVRALGLALLNRCGDVFYENGLERLLTALKDPSLADATETAVFRLLDNDEARQATDLLPALATVAPERAMAIVERIIESETLSSLTGLGVARTLERIDSPESIDRLRSIAKRDDLPAAQSVAMEALEQ